MKVSEDLVFTDWCCPAMEMYSRKPLKCISFDLNWRLYEMADIEPKACIFSLDKSGLAVDQGSWKQPAPAGQEPIPITFCPWCGTRIIFHNQ